MRLVFIAEYFAWPGRQYKELSTKTAVKWVKCLLRSTAPANSRADPKLSSHRPFCVGAANFRARCVFSLCGQRGVWV